MLFFEPLSLEKAGYIETSSGNLVSRKSFISGSRNVLVYGMTVILPHCTIRGDLQNPPVQGDSQVSVTIGKYCVLGEDSIIRPPMNNQAYGRVIIGDYVVIGSGSIVEASSIGNCVWIGKNCTIGPNTVIHPSTVISENTVVSPMSTIESFSVYGGNPARNLGDCPEGIEEYMKLTCIEAYHEKISWS